MTMMMSRFWSELKYNIRRRWNPVCWVPASILCLRFPFLYPRNRFTDKHYTNWKLHELQRDAHQKAYKLVGEFGSEENPAHIERVSKRWALVEKFYSGIEGFLGLFHAIPYYTELDALDTGWRKAFGMHICKDLKRALLEGGGRKALRRFRIEQWKEKYGTMRLYCHGGNEEVDKVITKYEYISERTCIVCGKAADYVTRGWVEPYCKEHLPDYVDPNDPEQVHEYYTEEFPFYGHYRIKFNKKEEPKDDGTR